MDTTNTKQFSVSRSDAFLVVVGLVLLGKLMHVFAFTLASSIESLVGPGGGSSVTFITVLFFFIIYLLLLKLLPTLATFVHEPENPSNRNLSYFLFLTAFAYALVMVTVYTGESDATGKFGVDWFLISTLIVLGVYFFTNFQKREEGKQTVSPADSEPLVLTSCPTEREASQIKNQLRDNGIQATIAGTHDVMFKADAPGSVCVLVPDKQADQAYELLRQTDS